LKWNTDNLAQIAVKILFLKKKDCNEKLEKLLEKEKKMEVCRVEI
jgi:phosphoribosylcarboxyaminoimidazole (NCAIR) mutase